MRLPRSLLFGLVLALVACSGAQARPLDLPAPIEATSFGVGDVFEMRIVGEDKLPFTFTVAPDGTVDLPYVKRLKVLGLDVRTHLSPDLGHGIDQDGLRLGGEFLAQAFRAAG